MTTIYDYVSFDTAGKDNDCGIIALAALAGAKRGTRVAYGAAARTLINAGAFSARGTRTTELFKIMRKYAGGRNAVWMGENGHSPASYLAKYTSRKNWTGLMVGSAVVDGNIVHHAMPCINGKLLNADAGRIDWLHNSVLVYVQQTATV